MGSASIWLLSLLLCWGLPSPKTITTYAAVYYVTPHSPNPDCPSGDPCLTINEYALGNHFDGDDNITLLFIHGEHNLTFRSLSIRHKRSLKMAPSYAQFQAEVVIQLSVPASLLVQNIHEVKIFELEFTSINDDEGSSISAWASFSDIGHLSIAGISMKLCVLSLGPEINATITKVFASNCSIATHPSQNKHNILAIRNSKFYFSLLMVKNVLIERWTSRSTIINEFSLDGSSLYNSVMRVRIQRQIVCEINILNTFIFTSQYFVRSSKESGIKIETLDTAKVYTRIQNSTIVGNYQGISIKLDDDSVLELNVVDCLIANNGIVYNYPGGVAVVHLPQSNAVSIIHITSTVLSGNVNKQIEILGFSGTTAVTVFDSTIRDTRNSFSPDGHLGAFGAGAFFIVGGGQNCSSVFINFTQNRFIKNTVGFEIKGKNCSHEVQFIGNTVVASNTIRIPFPQNGGLKILTKNWGTVNISNCSFTANRGKAMYFDSASVVVTIMDTVFSQNWNGILVDFWHPSSKNISIHIKNSLFEENNKVSLGVSHLYPLTSKEIDISLKNVTFVNNNNDLSDAGIVQVDGRVSLSIEDSCVFRGNHGSAIKAFWTTLTLSGVVIFEENMAFQGGAMYLSYSRLKLQSINKKDTSIVFVNNSATNAGGSIYIDRSPTTDFYSGASCFCGEIQGVSLEEMLDFVVNVTLVFINNVAVIGGMDIYGATPNSQCKLMLDEVYDIRDRFTNSIFGSVFKLSSSISSISSDPKRVCLCGSSSQLMCANFSHIFYKTKRYPGEVFPLLLAVVGFEFGTVTGPVYANLLPQANRSTSSMGTGEHVRQVDYSSCSYLNFTVNSVNKRETIVLTANTTKITKPDSTRYIETAAGAYHFNPYNLIPLNLLTVPVYVNVTLLDCPPGFQLTVKTGRCDCIKALIDIGISACSIYNSTPYITRRGNQWIKPTSSQDGILFSKFCPFNYCNQRVISLNLSDPDKQCAFNHTGILCGACPPELSLAIGSSRCLECYSNYHTLLLIAFTAAGVALVLIMKIVDMTVATGTINGLIFYSNIVWANQSVFFPPQSQTSALLHLLKTFIAWLNLDLGIETCFIQHLDGYWKTWLQFAFPAYIWLIAGLIILVSHYSTTATKIFGNNSVPVLGTLFLLSYAKLLRTILVVFEFTMLEHPVGTKTVWSFDGNIPYFSLKHSFLFTAAMLFLLALWLPYTFVLLFIQCLRRHSHHRLLRWVNQLKPLFDSYLGPLKVQHHYWIGLGLLARIVLLLTSGATLTTMPFITPVMNVLTALIFCMLVLNVYKKWQLKTLEVCFLINLAMFSSGALFVEAQGGSKDSLACISLGTTFTMFITIVGYHVWRRFHALKCRKKPTHKTCNNEDSVSMHSFPQDQSAPHREVTYQVVSVQDQRESMLENLT